MDLIDRILGLKNETTVKILVSCIYAVYCDRKDSGNTGKEKEYYQNTGKEKE